MPRKFIGDGADSLVPEFSDGLRTELSDIFLEHYRGNNAAHQAARFVDIVLTDAAPAIDARYWQSFELRKAELRAEREDLLRILESAGKKLRSLSSDFDRLLDPKLEPLELADLIDGFMVSIEQSADKIDGLPRTLKPLNKDAKVSLRMAIDVLRVLSDFGISTASTAQSDTNKESIAVRVLKMISDDMGLVRAPTTWRDTIQRAKREAPDLNT